MESLRVLEQIMDDSDYNISNGSTSGEEEYCAGHFSTTIDVLDAAQVCFSLNIDEYCCISMSISVTFFLFVERNTISPLLLYILLK